MDKHRVTKYENLINMGVSPYINAYKGNADIGEVLDALNKKTDEELAAKPVYTIAGRVMAIRTFGKSSFVILKDRTGELQGYIRNDFMPEQCYKIFEQLDTGDFIAIKGYAFRTKTGEMTICVEDLTMLTKTLKDMPEKWHGLKDVEKRFRQRYVDLMANDDVKEIFIKRSRIVQYLREFFINKDFLEVETPMLQSIPGGATAKPFVTYHNALDMQLYLRIAPELYLKRLVVGGMERVFEINRNFRNEGISVRHNPEFTMVEWYMAYADYHLFMDMVEEMFIEIATKINGKPMAYLESGEEIDLASPWARLTMEQALIKYSDILEKDMETLESVKNLAREQKIELKSDWGKGRIIMELFEELVEHQLINPTFIVDYPKEVSPLAKSKAGDPEVTERFEMFIGGIELVNGFNELNDPIDQKERFEKQVNARESGDDEAHMMDLDYINALEHGLPPTAGAGMGIDRFIMMLTGKRNIREVILFPHMRPEEVKITPSQEKEI